MNYEMMFKRKSFRRFNPELNLTSEELESVESYLMHMTRFLSADQSLQYKIVQREQTTCKRGEYCILIYSEQSRLALMNLGYVIEQLDFYLASLGIGACWYGMGKVKSMHRHEGLPFSIMLAIGKAEPQAFRKDYKKAKRKSDEELWEGEAIYGIDGMTCVSYIKYAPSTCNSQPWYFKADKNQLTVHIKPKEKMLVPKEKRPFYNYIDLGIQLICLETWFDHHGFNYERRIMEESNQFWVKYSYRRRHGD